MASYLEAFPSDILENIAFLTTNDLPLSISSLRPILSLLLTSSTVYHTLRMRSCPHLYARIFRTMFDTQAISRRFRFQVTDSALAKELVVRCDMLRRVKGRSRPSGQLQEDLQTAFWMVQESDGLNETHLRVAQFPRYLLEILKHWGASGEDPTHELRSLAIWLLCSTLTRQHICSLPLDVKATLSTSLLPFCRNILGHPSVAINSSVLSSLLLSRVQTHGPNGADVESTEVSLHEVGIEHRQHGRKYEIAPMVRYGREWVLDCPDSTPAAINLLFSLKEIDPLRVPEHLPETRSIALATQRSGPTKEDVRKIRGYNTMLFADTIQSDCRRPNFVPEYGNRSQGNDFDLRRMLLCDERIREANALRAMCGIMSGIWEGFYMQVAEVVATPPATIGSERRQDAPDFICRQPLQSAFTEFVCFDNTDPNSPVVDDASGLRNLPKLSLDTEGGFEFGGRKYERLATESDPHRENSRERDAREPVDIVLLGETLEEHELAWGGFRFAGRIRDDGSIILKREAKEDGGEGASGTWIFEGRVRFGTVFVGTWSPSTSNANTSPAIHGIFSMQKRAKSFTSW